MEKILLSRWSASSKTKGAPAPTNTMTPTPTQRVQALRQRRKALGLIRVEFYLTPSHAVQVKELIYKLTKEKK